MAELQLSEFYDRVARYERARAKGYGFEADGTLGRSFYLRPKRRGPLRVVLSVCLVLSTLIVLKAGIILFAGEGMYSERVARMQGGQSIDQLGAAILHIDPVSGFLVDQARIWTPKIKDFALGK
jgi:hypothetical protein